MRVVLLYLKYLVKEEQRQPFLAMCSVSVLARESRGCAYLAQMLILQKKQRERGRERERKREREREREVRGACDIRVILVQENRVRFALESGTETQLHLAKVVFVNLGIQSRPDID